METITHTAVLVFSFEKTVKVLGNRPFDHMKNEYASDVSVAL